MQSSVIFRSFYTICAVLLLSFASGTAQSSDQPKVPVLEVTGTSATPLTFDIEALRAIGSKEFETSTIWTKGVHRFEGVPLNALLAHLMVEGQAIEAAAINDYAIQIPMSDALSDGPIIAFAMDGEPMSRRAKGPLWIVYPFDSSSKYRTETVYARSIWQLNRLHIIK